MKSKCLALLLLLAVLLQGCIFDTTLFPSDTEGRDIASDGAFERPYAPRLAEIPFSEIVYERPDAAQLCAGIESLREEIEEAPQSLTSEAALSKFEELYDSYVCFNTMTSLAYLKYTLNLNDTYFDDEYNWCIEQSPRIEQALEKCYIAMANSGLRDDLETLYFGEGFFLYYDTNEFYSDDRVVELMQEESALQAEYMALQSDMTVEWGGEERLVSELFEDESIAYAEYVAICRLYYEKYNSQAAELFIKLIRLRREIAQTLEYDSYAQFAYDFYYERDYTPEQVARYTADLASELSGLYYAAVCAEDTADLETSRLMPLLRDTAHAFGGEIADACDYMETYGLYDVSASSSKMPGSYTTYLEAYEMPFLYVSPTGTTRDLLTVTHEFGHFVDGYVNCNCTDSVDCAEIFSQGLEYLMLDRVDLPQRQRDALTVSKLADSLQTFLTQACCAEFERRAYDLPDEELTPERLNELFLQCKQEFGLSFPGMEDLLAPAWIDVQHFFIAPFYVISYCVSNDAALQIYQLELENGSGLETYRTLLSLAPSNTLLSLLSDGGMESPFAEGRAAELADFFSEMLYD